MADPVAAALQVSRRTVERVGKKSDFDLLPDASELEVRKRDMVVPDVVGAVGRRTVYKLYAKKGVPMLDTRVR